MKKIILLTLVLPLVFSMCTTKPIAQKKKSVSAFVWVGDHKSRLGVKAELAKVLSIDVEQLEHYTFYNSNTRSKKGEGLESVANRETHKIKRAIALSLKKRMQDAFNTSLTATWDLDKTKYKPKIASFYKKSEGGYFVKTVAAVEKKELTDRRILNNLPLQYKLPLLKEMQLDYK